MVNHRGGVPRSQQVIFQMQGFARLARVRIPKFVSQNNYLSSAIKPSPKASRPSRLGAEKLMPLDARWTFEPREKKLSFFFLVIQESHRKFSALSHVRTTKGTEGKTSSIISINVSEAFRTHHRCINNPNETPAAGGGSGRMDLHNNISWQIASAWLPRVLESHQRFLSINPLV